MTGVGFPLDDRWKRRIMTLVIGDFQVLLGWRVLEGVGACEEIRDFYLG